MGGDQRERGICMGMEERGTTGVEEDLPPPRVPSAAYSEEYYLHHCGGSDEWRTSDGAVIAGIYPGSLHVAGLQPGETVVDIGTGRGELLVAALEAGARRAVGIEYSEAAVELARKTLAAHGVPPERGEVVAADARAIPLPDQTADLVTMLDVVEHLTPDELAGSLRQAHRLLRPGGRILVHTFPTRTVYEVTYRLQRLAFPRRLWRWPRNPRNEWERAMHVNEQTVTTLRRSLRAAGFGDVDVHPGQWVYTDFLPHARAGRLYHRLARHRLTARFGVGDLWGRGIRV
jgi:ubiquinone/menaquinone biosynthesis C-methylase UbiE